MESAKHTPGYVSWSLNEIFPSAECLIDRSDFASCSCLYSFEQLHSVLRLIAEHGFVYEIEALDALHKRGEQRGFDAWNAMTALVRNNVLEYRHDTLHSYDLPARITEPYKAVVSAPSPAALYRLRLAIKNGDVA